MRVRALQRLHPPKKDGLGEKKIRPLLKEDDRQVCFHLVADEEGVCELEGRARRMTRSKAQRDMYEIELNTKGRDKMG